MKGAYLHGYRERTARVSHSLSFDHPHRPEAGDTFGNAGLIHGLHNIRHVLVGVRHLLSHGAATLVASHDTAASHFLVDVDRVALLLCLGAAHHSAGAVASAAESFFHRA